MLFNRTSRTRKPVEESDDEMLLDAPVDTRKKAEPRRLRDRDTGDTSAGTANIGLSTSAVAEAKASRSRTPAASAAKSGSKAASKSAGPFEAADGSSIWNGPEDDPSSEPEMKKHRKESKGARKVKKT